MPRDNPMPVRPGTPVEWVAGWWRVVHLGAVLLALAISPSSYTKVRRRVLLHHLYASTAPALVSFTVVSTLVSLVLIRIVVVTALSYGLTQYALEMVVRVLVLELIPLAAALFAALRGSFAHAAAIAAMRDGGTWRTGPDALRREVLPRVVAGIFCALMLAAASCVVTLVVAYLMVYGLTASGFPAYTHTVGRIFTPAVALIFGLKILFFGITVALMPIASVLDESPRTRRTSAELHALVRMFFVIVLIEAASLVGNYY
jgi:phospholipid/cholesterol/gamma-HCH transport system permease protein